MLGACDAWLCVCLHCWGPEFRVLAKAHQRVYEVSKDDPELAPFLVPNSVPTNDLLASVDVLVTDFSSIAYDFVPTGKPVVYYSPDPESYRESRGYYVEPQHWPGPLVRTLDELGSVVRAAGSGSERDPRVTHAQSYTSTVNRVAPHDDGAATQRLVDTVFRGKDAAPSRVLEQTKPSVLIYLGDMRPNGITSAGMNLVANLDHDSVDVTVSFLSTNDPQRRRLMGMLDHRVRQLPRLGGEHPGLGQRRRRPGFDRLYELGAGRLDPEGRNDTLTDEWHRCFGSANFDHVADLSGYGPFFARLLLQGSNPGRRSIWLHNDMVADSQRMTDGVQHLKERLGLVFELYRFYDHLVSVSEPLSRINAQNLSRFAPPSSFTFASNTIDADRIVALARGPEPEPQPHDARLDLNGSTLREAVRSLAARYSPQEVLDEARLRLRAGWVGEASYSGKVFVTVGRLSPEKNHSRLLQAFSLVHDDEPDARLVVIGDGPLMSPLKQEARDLGLDLRTHVRFTGHVDNPFAIMSEADCFVLSSDYEGQPMVILEAKVLGLPVVATAFASVRGALREGEGVVTERSAEALADGMRAFLAGDVPSAPLDAQNYNAAAVQEFMAATGLGA